MLETGIILILASGYWILAHGNAFGLANYCKRIQLEHAELVAKKERGEALSPSECELLRYLRLNDLLDRASYLLLAFGVGLFLLGVIFRY